MSRFAALCLLILLAAAGAQAILPPDASVREPEIRARRIQNRKEYEKRMEERRELMVREYKRTRQAVDIPPWKRARVLDGAAEADRQVAAAVRSNVKKEKKSRFLVSIVLFILIGSAVGWVKYATDKKE